jgi:hypothetical protein
MHLYYIGGMPERRRFPPPWSFEETEPCFIVRDANREALAYVYFQDAQGRQSGGAPAHPRRGPAHLCQHRQAAGAAQQVKSAQKHVI